MLPGRVSSPYVLDCDRKPVALRTTMVGTESECESAKIWDSVPFVYARF